MSEDVGINHHLVHSLRLTILSVLHPWRSLGDDNIGWQMAGGEKEDE